MTTFTDPAETWNRRFTGAGDGFLFGREPNAWLRRHAAWPPGARVLCVADGEGRNSVWLARQGLQVDAFDIAEAGVRKARALAAEAGVRKARALAAEAGVTVRYDVADVDGWAWPEATYDGVAAIFVQFADPALRARMFAHMQRCLKPGGLLLLQGYTPQQLVYRTGGPGQVEHLYTEPLLREAFAGMEILHLEAYEDDLAEGAGHHGRSALIGLVARRP